MSEPIFTDTQAVLVWIGKHDGHRRHIALVFLPTRTSEVRLRCDDCLSEIVLGIVQARFE
jgi:hypothetical protein